MDSGLKMQHELLIKCFFFIVPTTVGYVNTMKEILFNLSQSEMKEVFIRYSSKAPQPLNTKFPDRLKKDAAVKAHKERIQQRQKVALFPPSKDFVIIW